MFKNGDSSRKIVVRQTYRLIFIGQHDCTFTNKINRTFWLTAALP